MPQYIPPITKVQRGKNHHYQDGAGHRIPGVTTILGNGIPKPNLITWAANITAEVAVNDWDTLADMPVAARLKALQDARYSTTDKAKKRGTEVHGYGEQLVKGEAVAKHSRRAARPLRSLRPLPQRLPRRTRPRRSRRRRPTSTATPAPST